MRLEKTIGICALVLACQAGNPGAESETTTVPMVPAIDVTTWPDAPFRWRDIAEFLYAASYRDAYLYEQALVELTYHLGPDSTFLATLQAQNLKPNFAYQAKLVGKPTGIWGEDGDDLTNENIGYAGRWWRHQPNPGNSNDDDYEAHHDDPEYIYEGYLLFDFLVTDHLGAATKSFLLDSSYHVLWWSHQRTPGPCDSPVLWHTVLGYPEDPAYDEAIGPVDVGVYAEIERLCTGETRLPAGEYHCRFVLTEESFHQSGEYDGWWAAAMTCDTLGFVLSDATGVSDGPADAAAWRAAFHPNPLRERSTLTYRIDRPGPLRLEIYDTAGRRVRRMAAPGSGPGPRRLLFDGRDDAGRPLPSGLYPYRLASSGSAAARGKLLVLR